MIFIDSNVPMYLVGADHPNKELSRSALSRMVANAEVLVTDAEVLQEILHRYVAIDRRAAIDDAMAAILGIVDEVFPVERTDVVRAQDTLVDSPLSARDALHVAVMRRRGVDHILTFDAGFDSAPDLVRLPQM
jgi:predicted nucleic acid-binding protein